MGCRKEIENGVASVHLCWRIGQKKHKLGKMKLNGFFPPYVVKFRPAVAEESKDGRPGLYLAETFSTTILQPVAWTEFDKTWREEATQHHLTKFVFPWPLFGRDISTLLQPNWQRMRHDLDHCPRSGLVYRNLWMRSYFTQLLSVVTHGFHDLDLTSYLPGSWPNR